MQLSQELPPAVIHGILTTAHISVNIVIWHMVYIEKKSMRRTNYRLNRSWEKPAFFIKKTIQLGVLGFSKKNSKTYIWRFKDNIDLIMCPYHDNIFHFVI